MDKLEQYLDRVCRGIGGPRSLRQHVRQELREHLLDAASRHQSAGASPSESLDRALAEFGTSDEVKSELEATHGHRVMGVVIDKAMQWKEKTMKAKWLWTSWANLGLAMVIALEILFITFVAMFIAPKFQLLLRDGLLDPAMLDEPAVSWMLTFLNGVWDVGEKYTTFLLLFAVVAWGLFEWRVRGENKPMMRLSALATAAFGLTAVVVLTTGSLVVLFCLGLPTTGRLARPFALQQIAQIDASASAMEQAVANKDWKELGDQAERANSALENLTKTGPALPALTSRNQPPSAEELRAHVKAASETLAEAQKAIRDMDETRLAAAIRKFREASAPLLDVAKKP